MYTSACKRNHNEIEDEVIGVQGSAATLGGEQGYRGLRLRAPVPTLRTAALIPTARQRHNCRATGAQKTKLANQAEA